MIAFSLGLRASNSSATRGRPPVMSRVRAASRGMRARASPASTLWPSSTTMIAPGGGGMTPPPLGSIARQRQARTQVLLLRLGRVVSNDALDDAGRLVGLLRHRPVLDQVLVLHRTGLLGDYRTVRRVPFGDAVATADDMAALAQQMRAIRHAVCGQLAAVHVENGDLARARQRDVPAARVSDRRHVAELDCAIDRRFEIRLLVVLRGAADVEGP